MTTRDAANFRDQIDFMMAHWNRNVREERRGVMEMASCVRCGDPIERHKYASNKKKYCGNGQCLKHRKLMIKNSVAKFSDLPPDKPTTYTADIQYHGIPNA